MKIQSVEEVKAEEQRRATLKDVKKAISKNFKVKKVISNDKIMDELIGSRIDVVFNLSTGIRGESRQSQIPAVLEMLGIAYVGSGVLAHGIALNKVTAKKLFNYHNVPGILYRHGEVGSQSAFSIDDKTGLRGFGLWDP